jgi:hypothetical protein
LLFSVSSIFPLRNSGDMETLRHGYVVNVDRRWRHEKMET